MNYFYIIYIYNSIDSDIHNLKNNYAKDH